METTTATTASTATTATTVIAAPIGKIHTTDRMFYQNRRVCVKVELRLDIEDPDKRPDEKTLDKLIESLERIFDDPPDGWHNTHSTFYSPSYLSGEFYLTNRMLRYRQEEILSRLSTFSVQIGDKAILYQLTKYDVIELKPEEKCKQYMLEYSSGVITDGIFKAFKKELEKILFDTHSLHTIYVAYGPITEDKGIVYVIFGFEKP